MRYATTPFRDKNPAKQALGPRCSFRLIAPKIQELSFNTVLFAIFMSRPCKRIKFAPAGMPRLGPELRQGMGKPLPYTFRNLKGASDGEPVCQHGTPGHGVHNF